MFLSERDKAQAVLFFGKEGIVRELLYNEFEALLDGFVPLEEWSGRTVKAAYVEINSKFCVTAAVFFTVSFDDSGAVEASWNIPLMDLARTSTTGPDMGAGPIHIACASKCPVAFYKKWLWDPEAAHLKLMDKPIKRNRMGIHFKKEESDTLPGQGGGNVSISLGVDYQKELKAQMDQLLKEQRSQLSNLVSDKDNAVKEVRLEYAAKLESLQQILQDKDAQLHEAEKRNEELKQTIDGQVQKIEGLREYFEHKLERAQGNEQEVIDSLKTHYEAETEAKLNSVTKELSDLLKMKEVELVYRIEHEEQLQDEIDRLRQENQELLANSGDFVLQKLSEKGVNFVTYQTGAGHITIPLSEISNFVENPSAFTAAYCGVSEKHYLAWLKHYQAPVCIAEDDNGDMCCANIPRKSSPDQFVPGESEYCEQHNTMVSPSLQSVKQ